MNQCKISGCRYLQTTCQTCGRLVIEKILPARLEWISVKDSLPEEDENVLIFNGEINKACRMSWDNDQGWIWTHYGMEAYDVTHWMELPSPPK